MPETVWPTPTPSPSNSPAPNTPSGDECNSDRSRLQGLALHPTSYGLQPTSDGRSRQISSLGQTSGSLGECLRRFSNQSHGNRHLFGRNRRPDPNASTPRLKHHDGRSGERALGRAWRARRENLVCVGTARLARRGRRQVWGGTQRLTLPPSVPHTWSRERPAEPAIAEGEEMPPVPRNCSTSFLSRCHSVGRSSASIGAMQHFGRAWAP